MKQLGTILILMALLSSIGIAADAARPVKKIGVLMWSEDPGYYETLKGVKDQLREEGFGESAAQFTVQNARGGKLKLAGMSRKFAASHLDLVVSIGTSATIAAAREIKDTPLVFANVYDPVQSGIVGSWENSGNNATGASSKVSMAKLVGCLAEFPPMLRLAVLYTPGEKNSEEQLKELQKLSTDSQIKVVPVILSREDDAVQIMTMIAPTVDAIYLSGSSIVGNKVGTIVAMATQAKVITITHIGSLVHQGVLLGVCATPYLVGRLAGEKGVKVLKGAKPSSIPVQTLDRYEVMLNLKTAKSGGFQVPASFMKTVTRVVIK